jgi:hypothetical protein
MGSDGGAVYALRAPSTAEPRGRRTASSISRFAGAAAAAALALGAGACTGTLGLPDDMNGTGAHGAGGSASGAGGGAVNSGAGGGAAPTGGGGATGAIGTGGSTSGAGGAGAGAGGARGTGGAIGGSGGRIGTGGTSGIGGAPGVGGRTGAGGSTGTAFSQCRFHFGTVDAIARGNPAMIPQLDFYTPGWMGSISDTFDMGYVCTDTRAGGTFANQVPVIVAYVAAFYVKRHSGLSDCGAAPGGATTDLCHQGAAAIQANLAAIVNVYRSFAQGFAACYGTTRPIIFEMEPDFYQYTYTGSTGQTQPWTYAQAGQIMGQFVGAMKPALPNALFSMDISPWVGTNNNTGSNGSDNGLNWYSNFDMSQFTFINTSGGSTNAAAAQIRGNAMTWAGVRQATGKPILADTGYGFNGSSAGPDPAWDSAANINARMLNGVVSISQYNPAGSWGTTIAGIRGQLQTPPICP